MKHSLCNPMTVGILGGGQLATMLCDAARNLGIKTNLFATNKDDPAIAHADQHILGSFESIDNLEAFFKTCSTVIYENEFIKAKILVAAAAQTKIMLLPSPEIMARCADKLEQKYLFQQLGLPSSKFLAMRVNESATNFLQRACTEFKQGCVIKWAKGGYDGGGVKIFRGTTVPPADLVAFIDSATNLGSRVYAEELITFEDEVALVCMRSLDGTFKSYPLVHTVQENHICTLVVGPAFRELQAVAERRAESLMTELGIVGVIAIEFFIYQNDILINEMAPRVHNSGHVTMDGCVTSQFENHLRAVLGMPFGPISPKYKYGMINILGPDDYAGPLGPPAIRHPQVRVHWYEKKSSRPGRKMGHINFWVDQGADDWGRLLRFCRQQLAQWEQTAKRGTT